MNVWSPGQVEPEVLAYALARFSRSPDSLKESLEWVESRKEDAASRFMDSYYFDYGHASIADLGHLAMAFEDISLLAAVEVEDEQLWDGQERSTRYQDFETENCVVVPRELYDLGEERVSGQFLSAARRQLEAYARVRDSMIKFLKRENPLPPDWDTSAGKARYERNISARAFDVARYFLPMGVKTNVGQVTSIRSLERQISRLLSSELAECRELAGKIKEECERDGVAPTLAKRVSPDAGVLESRNVALETALKLKLLNLNENNTKKHGVTAHMGASLIREIAAGLLFTNSNSTWTACYEVVSKQGDEWCASFVQDALVNPMGSRGSIPRVANVGYEFNFEIDMDFGGYRDMHRHRRCQQLFQRIDVSPERWVDEPPFELPEDVWHEFRQGQIERYGDIMDIERVAGREAALYLLPLGHSVRAMFRMDLGQLGYITKLRSGVKGHQSYREIAYQMAESFRSVNAPLGALLIKATSPHHEEPLTR